MKNAWQFIIVIFLFLFVASCAAPFIGGKTQVSISIANPYGYQAALGNTSRLIVGLSGQQIRITAKAEEEEDVVAIFSKDQNNKYTGVLVLSSNKAWTIRAEALSAAGKAYARAEAAISTEASEKMLAMTLMPAPEYPIRLIDNDTDLGTALEDFGNASLYPDISKNNPGIIIISENFSVQYSKTVNKHIYISGENKTLTFATESEGNHGFNITGGSLTLANITLKGPATPAKSRLVYIDGGLLTLSEGALLTGNNNSSPAQDTDGGAVYLNSGSLIMEKGSRIEDSSSFNGGGVYVNAGRFTSSGGSIYASSFTSGGAVYLADDIAEPVVLSNMELNGVGYGNGGAVYLGKNVVFKLSNSVINNSISGVWGGAIFASSLSKIILDNSEISDNLAETAGGIYLSFAAIDFITDNGFTVFAGNTSTNQAAKGANIYGEGGNSYNGDTLNYYINSINGQSLPDDTSIENYLIGISSDNIDGSKFEDYFKLLF